MKWKKLGQIFCPSEHNLLGKNAIFAQSPQAIVFDNYVRIFFSTRLKDGSGKFLSFPTYIDMNKEMTQIIHIAKESVIPLGELGCFDEHGIFPLSPTKVNDKLLGFTTGWNRKKSVSADASIGLAVSYDEGKTFEKRGSGPILSSSINDPFLVGDAFVMKEQKTFHMWYISGEKWIESVSADEPERVYKIRYAHSEDTINWNRHGDNIIADAIGEDECQALPTVVHHNGLYHMYFCYRHAIGFRTEKGKGYKIGYAYSTDMINWQRDDAIAGITLSNEGWDSDMQCYPYVFKCEGRLFMLYNGNEFGKDGFGLAVLDET